MKIFRRCLLLKIKQPTRLNKKSRGKTIDRGIVRFPFEKEADWNSDVPNSFVMYNMIGFSEVALKSTK